jgi:hypothetical protein
LSGHDHDYERFARMGINGPTKSGMRELVSGLGGKNLYPLGTVRTGSQVRFDDGFGALFLTLNDGSYSWEFRTIGGALVDSGSDVCLS